MKLYHRPQTRSARVLWMLEECGADYEIEIVDVTDQSSRKAYLAINPMGKVPALENDGVVITETAAICAWLADRFPDQRLAPPIGTKERAQYYRWLFFMAGALEPSVIQKALGWPTEHPGAVGWGDPDRVMSVLRKEIPAAGWLVGETFTAADLLIGGALSHMSQFGQAQLWPEAQAYADRCTDRPALLRARAKDA
jgi:glutathione S-transferase